MKNKKHIFTDEEIKSISDLGDVLRSILNRLITEGKAKVVDGKVIFLEVPDKKKWL